MLVIGRSYSVGPIQEGDDETGAVTDEITKLAEEITEKPVEGKTGTLKTGAAAAGAAGTKSIAYRGGNSAGTKTGAFVTGL